MNKRRDILRISDRIEVTNPIVVVRVGYPKCHADYVEEVKIKHKAAVEALFRTPRMQKRAYVNLAYEALGAAGFGGIERTVHVRDMPELQGYQATVQSARTVVTGKYYPSSTYQHYDGDYDYEPGGLSDCVYIRLVSVIYDGHTVELLASNCRRVP